MTPIARILVFGVAAALALGVTTPLGPDGGAAQSLPQVKCDRPCLQVKVDRHLLMMGELGRDEALQASQKDLSASGPLVVRVVQDTYNRWARPVVVADPKLNAGPAEMRWRAVHLLGSLGIRDAIPVLFDIARKPLPNPKDDENSFADEVRVRLRSVVGLEKLKAVDELKELYELGGVLRNPAAASLFVLGVNVGNVSRVEATRALASDTADPKDHNPGKGRSPQAQKPGRQRTNPKRRPDTPVIGARGKGE